MCHLPRGAVRACRRQNEPRACLTWSTVRKVMFTRVRRVSCGALAVAAAALLTSSCSGGRSAAYSGAMTSITLGALPVVDDVSAYIAADQGIFQKYGLNVTIKQVLTSAVAIPEMQK